MYKLLYIYSNTNSSLLRYFKSFISSPKINKKIYSHKFKLIYDISDNFPSFLIELVNYDGSILFSSNSFDSSMFEHIINIDDKTFNHSFDSYSSEKNNDYYYKYIKYKSKYLGLKFFIDHYF